MYKVVDTTTDDDGKNINMVKASGLAELKKHQPFICRLGNSNSDTCRQLLRQAQPQQIKSIISVVYNILKGAVPLTPAQKRLVRKHKDLLRKFVNSSCCLSKKNKAYVNSEAVKKVRRHLSEQKGGILPILLPLLALAGKAALAGAVTAGTGLAVKKLAGQ